MGLSKIALDDDMLADRVGALHADIAMIVNYHPSVIAQSEGLLGVALGTICCQVTPLISEAQMAALACEVALGKGEQQP